MPALGQRPGGDRNLSAAMGVSLGYHREQGWDCVLCPKTLWRREESKGDCHVSKVVKAVLVAGGVSSD